MPDNEAAARIWQSIKHSIDVQELRDFVKVFSGTEEAYMAQRRCSELEAIEKRYTDLLVEIDSVDEEVESEGYNWGPATIARVKRNHCERFIRQNPEHPRLADATELRDMYADEYEGMGGQDDQRWDADD